MSEEKRTTTIEDAARRAEQLEREAKSQSDLYTYTHVFQEPFTYQGETYEELTFNWKTLNGKDTPGDKARGDEVLTAAKEGLSGTSITQIFETRLDPPDEASRKTIPAPGDGESYFIKLHPAYLEKSIFNNFSVDTESENFKELLKSVELVGIKDPVLARFTQRASWKSCPASAATLPPPCSIRLSPLLSKKLMMPMPKSSLRTATCTVTKFPVSTSPAPCV